VPRLGTDQATEVTRLIALGACGIATGATDASWLLLADPDGNELRLFGRP
jgi:hypothetical protein